MAYPSLDQVLSAAQAAQVDSIVVFAYAAERGSTPAPADAAMYQQQIARLASSFCLSGSAAAPTTPNIFALQRGVVSPGNCVSVPPVYVYGYIQANGGQPGSLGQLTAWMVANGYLSSGGALTGSQPYPGQGYPPGGAPITTPVGTPVPTPTPTPTTGGIDFSSLAAAFTGIETGLQAHEGLVLGGIAAFIVLRTGLLGQLLGRRR